VKLDIFVCKEEEMSGQGDGDGRVEGVKEEI
jgi:hypothetical protein